MSIVGCKNEENKNLKLFAGIEIGYLGIVEYFLPFKNSENFAQNCFAIKYLNLISIFGGSKIRSANNGIT